jgi:hypothetical protein
MLLPFVFLPSPAALFLFRPNNEISSFQKGINLETLLPADGNILTSTVYDAGVGSAVSNSGDFNNDNFFDVAVGAPNYNNDQGFVRLILGTTDMTSTSTVTIYGQAGSQCGAAVSFGGKSVSGKSVNNDAFGDLLIGAPEFNSDTGKAYLIFGSTSLSTVNLPPSSASVGISISHPTAICAVGTAVSIGGDINGDGYLDFAIGAPKCDNHRGKVFVIYGGSSLAAIDLGSVSGNNWGFKVLGENVDFLTGCAIALNGDINNDGKADLVIGASGANSNRGKVYIIWGKTGTITDFDFSTTWNSNSEGITIRGESGGVTAFGVSIAVGDITKDNKADVLIGAHNYNGLQGKAYLLYGHTLITTITNVASVPLVQGFWMLGPIDSRFGKAVSIGGDVNLDGYNDLMVGAYAYSVNRGICYLVFGAPTASLGNLNFSSPTSPPATAAISIKGAYPNDLTGTAVAISGDSDHDGRADIILGAPGRGLGGDGTTYIIYGKSAMTNYDLVSSIPTLTPSARPTSQPTVQPSFIIASESLNDGLVAYYPLNGDANDKSGNGLNGVVYAGVGFAADRFDEVNAAVCFSGSSTSYVEVLHGNSFNFPRDMSIAFWILPDDTQFPWSRVIDKNPYDTSFPAAGWSIEHSSNWKNIYRYRFYDGPDHYRHTANLTLLPNIWQHVVYVKASQRIDQYINGALTGTYVAPSSAIVNSGNYPLTFGARLRGQAIPAQNIANSFIGCLDDIFIYNRSLLVGEVQQLAAFHSPTALPTRLPSRQPTGQPTNQPTSQPSRQPSRQPTGQPTNQPTAQPSRQPSGQPTDQPTNQPTSQPSRQPSGEPTDQPTNQPTSQPSRQPSGHPTGQPTNQPTSQPSRQPSGQPTGQPTYQPTAQPSRQPSGQPTDQPTNQPTTQPSRQPSGEPTDQPTNQPTSQPSRQPSGEPTDQPTNQPTSQPSRQPSGHPTGQPTNQPTSQPSRQPSGQPTDQPTNQPTSQPSEPPSRQPSTLPSLKPSSQPTSQPYHEPSAQPSRWPTVQPTAQPLSAPTVQPSSQTSLHPTLQPTVFIEFSALRYGLVAYYPLDGNALDKSGNGNNGLMKGGVGLAADRFGNANAAASLDGINDYIEMPGQQFNFPNDFSVSLWVKPFSSQITSAFYFSKSHYRASDSSAYAGWVIAQNSAALNNVIICYVYSPGLFYGSVGTQLVAQAWNHYVVTKSGGTVRSYLNGHDAGTAVSPNPHIVPNGNLPLMIGAGNYGMTSPASDIRTFLNAIIDDIFIYNRTLTDNEVVQLYSFHGPTSQPTNQPSSRPTQQPSSRPSAQPSTQPSTFPSRRPTSQPSGQPSVKPSRHPSSHPSCQPSVQPTLQPSSSPSAHSPSQPSTFPSRRPTAQPSGQPSVKPGRHPSSHPSCQPSVQPTQQPVAAPLSFPSSQPSVEPSGGFAGSTFSLRLGLVAAYTFDRSSTKDKSGNGNDGVKNGGVIGVEDRYGNAESALSFNGINGYIEIPGQQFNFGLNMSISFWVLPNSTQLPSCKIFDKSYFSFSSGLQAAGWAVGQSASNTNWYYYSYVVGLGSATSSNIVQYVSTSWNHVVYAKEGSILRSYVNGIPYEQVVTTLNIISNGNLPLIIGALNGGSSSPATGLSQFWKGFIDDIYIYNRTLTAEEIRMLGTVANKTLHPTSQPSQLPSSLPSSQPFAKPSSFPSRHPLALPSSSPSFSPSSLLSRISTVVPSALPSRIPSICPSTSMFHSSRPSSLPSSRPSFFPSTSPSCYPSSFPTSLPTVLPFFPPLCFPSSTPNSLPFSVPSTVPGCIPSAKPFGKFIDPSSLPSLIPVSLPSQNPASVPSQLPSAEASVLPSSFPSLFPTALPLNHPLPGSSSSPSTSSSLDPSSFPSCIPVSFPVRFPSVKPSSFPTSLNSPIVSPTSQASPPASSPSSGPYSFPTSLPLQMSSSAPIISSSSFPSMCFPSSSPTVSPAPDKTTHSSYSPVVGVPLASPSLGHSLSPTPHPSVTGSRSSSFSPPSKSCGFKGVLNVFGSILPSTGNMLGDIHLRSASLESQSYFIFGRKEPVQTIDLNYDDNVNKGFLALSPDPLIGSVLRQDTVTRSVSIVSDLNNDSFPDLMFGDPLSSKCYLYFGNNKDVSFRNVTLSLIIEGESSRDYFGWSIGSIGDMNQDGIKDVAISGRNNGKIYVIYGRSPWTSSSPSLFKMSQMREKIDGFIISSSFSFFNTGISLANNVGDFNGDGFIDIAFSLLKTTPSSHLVTYIVYGKGKENSNLQLPDASSSASAAEPCYEIVSSSLAFAGISIDGIGDMNGDGYDDLVIGSIPFENGGSGRQRSYVVYGRSSNSSKLASLNQLFLSEMKKEDGVVVVGGGFIVSGVGDVNGDGYSDIMITNYEGWKRSGNAYLLTYPVLKNVTSFPTFLPSSVPTVVPSYVPSSSPSSSSPSIAPTVRVVTSSPNAAVIPTLSPSQRPISSKRPTVSPSLKPVVSTKTPSRVPTRVPTTLPTFLPFASKQPTRDPTVSPSVSPTNTVHSIPSFSPSMIAINDYQHFSIDDCKEGSITDYLIPDGDLLVVISCQEGEVRLKVQNKGKGSKIYQIPRSFSSPSSLNITITYFDFSKDRLDLTAFPAISSPFSLSYSLDPLTLFLSKQAKVIIASAETLDFLESNFLLSPSASSSSSSSSSDSSSTDSKGLSLSSLSLSSLLHMDISAIIALVLLIGFGCCFCCLGRTENRSNRRKKGKKVDEVHAHRYDNQPCDEALEEGMIHHIPHYPLPKELSLAPINEQDEEKQNSMISSHYYVDEASLASDASSSSASSSDECSGYDDDDSYSPSSLEISESFQSFSSF